MEREVLTSVLCSIKPLGTHAIIDTRRFATQFLPISEPGKATQEELPSTLGVSGGHSYPWIHLNGVIAATMKLVRGVLVANRAKASALGALTATNAVTPSLLLTLVDAYGWAMQPLAERNAPWLISRFPLANHAPILPRKHQRPDGFFKINFGQVPLVGGRMNGPTERVAALNRPYHNRNLIGDRVYG